MFMMSLSVSQMFVVSLSSAPHGKDKVHMGQYVG